LHFLYAQKEAAVEETFGRLLGGTSVRYSAGTEQLADSEQTGN